MNKLIVTGVGLSLIFGASACGDEKPEQAVELTREEREAEVDRLGALLDVAELALREAQIDYEHKVGSLSEKCLGVIGPFIPPAGEFWDTNLGEDPGPRTLGVIAAEACGENNRNIVEELGNQYRALEPLQSDYDSYNYAIAAHIAKFLEE